MFSQLKKVVDLICTGLSNYRQFKSQKERRDTILGILEVYFFLKDCVDEGEKLITDVGEDPVARINSMALDEAHKVITDWDVILRKQGMRLYALQSHIFGQDHLVIINPDLQKRISEVIGYKMDRTETLHGIGATLFLRNKFPIEETDEEKARLITRMMGGEYDGLLDLEKITAEVSSLKQSLDDYRTVVERFVTDEEMLSLSKRARGKTIIT